MVIVLLLITLISSVIVQAVQPQPWQQTHKQLQQKRDSVFARLVQVHATLVVRVRDEDPALLTRLSLDPPRARATGYGLLPKIRRNASKVTVIPRQTFYSLDWLEGRLQEEFQKADKLAEVTQTATQIEPLVGRFETSLKTLRNLEDNLSYHGKWQKAVIQYPAYYRKKNKLVALAREINTLKTNNAPPEQIAVMRQRLNDSVAPFRPTPALQILNLAAGEMVLPVTICTDIEDADFLLAFQEGVQVSFSQSPPARARRFSIDLKWRFIAANTLYPDSVPGRGAKIDLNAHRALFPACPLVLTTGAASLNARVGSHIFLGTRPVSRRTLAHEFSHLLGFEDAYVRGFDGEPGGPYGVVIVEWTGLTADLIGDSSRGQVSEAMIATLITAYAGSTVR